MLTADLSQLSAQVSAIDAQADVKRSEQQRLTSTIEAQTTLVATLQKRVDMRAGLVPSGAGSKASVFDGQEVLQRETAILVGEKGQLGESENAVKSLAAERQKQKRNKVDSC